MRIFFVILLIFPLVSSRYSCIGRNNRAVNWYLIKLFPESTTTTKDITYSYIDDSMVAPLLLTSPVAEFPLTFTLKATIRTLAEEEIRSNVAFWNDQHKNGTSSGRAHAKGGLAYTDEGGYILDHSLPKFPLTDDNNQLKEGYALNLGTYAQHFYCIGIDKEEVENYAKMVAVARPFVLYASSKVDKVNTKPNDEISQILSNKFKRVTKDDSAATDVAYKNGLITVFAKSVKSRELPWDKAIANKYDKNFFIFTWLRNEEIPSICEGEKQVVNVKTVQFEGLNYKVTNNHAKWQVSDDGSTICFGDLNHETSQFKRGGLILCTENETLGKYFRKAVSMTDCDPNWVKKEPVQSKSKKSNIE